MSLTLLVVTYELTVPTAVFEKSVTEHAPGIAETPELHWKIWGLDPETGAGLSLYLFADAGAASAFADGPVIAALRSGPTLKVTTRVAPINEELSALTLAGPILNAAKTARAAV